MDEHRVGLKPILRRVWVRRGKRPQVIVRPRYEWLYVYGFVCPETGATEFWLAPSADTDTFGSILRTFLRGRDRAAAAAVLVLDRAGWHVAGDIQAMQAETSETSKAERSEGAPLALRYLPAYSPELNPVERLWLAVRERIDVFDEAVRSRLEALRDCVAEIIYMRLQRRRGRAADRLRLHPRCHTCTIKSENRYYSKKHGQKRDTPWKSGSIASPPLSNRISKKVDLSG